MTDHDPQQGVFLATAAPPDPRPSLDDLLVDDADHRLEVALDALADVVARARAEDADEPLDPDVEALLEARTADPDAPLEWRSLHDRVHRGALTWSAFWAAPHREAGGTTLWAEVASESLRALAADVDRAAATAEVTR